MKKFTVIFLFFLCFYLNVIGVIPVSASGNTFPQGIYKLSDLNATDTSIFTIQNVSESEGMYLYILDSNQVIMESIRLVPSPQKLDTVPIKPDYIILIIGKGTVYLVGK